MLTAQVSKLKLFLLFALAFGIGSSQFFGKYNELTLAASGRAVDPALWIGLMILSSSWVVACLILVIFKVPRTIEITEEAILYKVGFGKNAKEILWKGITQVTHTVWGAKFAYQNKALKLTLFWFPNRDTKKILGLISEKTHTG